MNNPAFPVAPPRLKGSYRRCHLAAAFAVLLQPAMVKAQSSDAGSLIRELESANPTLPPPDRQPSLDIPVTESAKQASADTDLISTIHVQRIVIVGNSVFPDKALHALVADLEQAPQSLDGLRAATQRITHYYQRRGYPLARAYLPPQDVSNGLVHIQVQEASYGSIDIINDSRLRDGILRAVASTLKPGTPIHKQPLERALSLLDELAGVEASSVLRAGQRTGTTDLHVQAEATPLLTGSIDTDNHGGASSGKYRLGAGLDIYSPLRIGDALRLRVLSSNDDQRYYRIHYGIPINASGTQLQLDTSTMRYRLGGAFSVLEASGRADIRGVFLRHALIRRHRISMDIALGREHKSLHDNMDLFDLRARKRIALWNASLTLNTEDNVLGGGRTSVNLSHARGDLGLLDADSQITDAAFTRSAGRFERTNLHINRLQRTGNHGFLILRGSAQWASRNLDGAEKFGLGGPYGVRAYALDVASGDQGWQTSVEWRLQPAPRWHAGSFIDTGRLRTNRRPWNDDPNRLRLTAAGLRLGHSSTKHMFSATAAWPISTSGTVQERRKPRLWLQASRYF